MLVAGRQRAGGDQDAAQVPERLAVGQLVEGGVGQRPFACRELTQDRCGGVLVQPVQHGVGAVVAGQVVVQGLQPGMNRAGVVAQKLIQALPQRAACAPARAVLGVLAASRAGVPEGRGAGAGRAERAGGRPAANRPDAAAAGAACAPLLAGVAPRLAGDLGDLGGSQPRADRADHRLGRPAGRAQRPPGVRTLTTRRRAQLTHVSRLAGSEIRQ